MKITDERHVRVTLDDDTNLDFDCASDGTPEMADIEGHDGAMNVEWLERMAAACRAVRERAGDARLVCADHGYYDPPKTTSPVELVLDAQGRRAVQLATCPSCAMKQRAAITTTILQDGEPEL